MAVTANLFTQDLTIDQLLAKSDRLRENLLLGKRQLFDSGKYVGQISAGDTKDFEVRFDKLMGWMDQYEELMRALYESKIDREEWHCKQCGELVFIPWNKLCSTCMARNHRTKFADIMTQRGFVKLEVATFGGEIILIVNEKWHGSSTKHITYKLSELRELRFATTAQLRLVHKTKKLFGGSVIRSYDPRPDYEEDWPEWESLLAAAKDSKLFGALHGFRCYGAGLTKKAVTGWQIIYRPDREGFTDQADFDSHYSLWFRGHESELKRLFGKIGVNQ